MAESWVLAWARLCRKGEMNVAQAKSTLVPGASLFWAECQLKAECPPGPAVCTVEGRVVDSWVLGLWKVPCLWKNAKAFSHRHLDNWLA